MFTVLVTETPFIARVRDEVIYTSGSNSFLGSKPKPLEVVGTLTKFCVLAFNVPLQVSVLIALGFDQSLQLPHSLQAGESNN